MKLVGTVVIVTFASVLIATASESPQTGDLSSSPDDVVATMMRLDAVRKSEMKGYTAFRRYVAVNKDRRAEMVVRVEASSDGTKQFTILSEGGSGAIRKHVFYKLLSEESDASRRATRDGTRITPENYTFKLIGRETIESGPAYVLSIIPKADSKYLIEGKIWINANDYSIVRIEGRPARNPSFWVHDVHLVHTYQKVGQFWLASSTSSTSEVRIFGQSKLTITSSDYVLNRPELNTASTNPTVSMVR